MNIIECNLNFKSLSYGNNPIMLVLHHAEAKSCTIQDIHAWHLANGWSGCGYHFLVRKDGSIYRGRPESAIGAHCPGANNKSIGICVEGNYATETMPIVQKQALIELGLYLKNKYSLKQIYGHKELYSTECPGANYPLSEIRQAILNGITATTSTVKASDAIKALQYDLNIDYNAKLALTGIVDQATIAALIGIQNIIVKGHKSSVVKWIQQKLIGYGYLAKGKDTGIYDEATFQAVTNMQKNWDRPTDGVLRIETWNILLNN